MINNKFVSAVIVAAGSSSRMKSGISKQLLKINGIPVLKYTVSAFIESGAADEIIVVCPPNDMQSFQNLFENLPVNIKLTSGGSTRQQSVYNGVSITDGKCEIIAIHDGARPLIDSSDINRVVSDCIAFGASTLAVPVKDTIKTVENGTVVDTPPRDKLYSIQTPQVFSKAVYLEAFKKAKAENKDYTDDCQLIESVGGKVHITVGSYTNIKITTPEDIFTAEAFLKNKKG